MGIDIYAKWKGQGEEEKKKQFTGFATDAGNVGYLREAYHGAPYVTKFFVSEAFDGGEAQIPAKTLTERVPVAVLMSLYREQVVYKEKDDKGILEGMNGLTDALNQVFNVEMKDESHKDFAKTLTQHHIDYIQKRIASKDLPAVAQSFVDFARLCEVKEAESGEPCTIIASY